MATTSTEGALPPAPPAHRSAESYLTEAVIRVETAPEQWTCFIGPKPAPLPQTKTVIHVVCPALPDTRQPGLEGNRRRALKEDLTAMRAQWLPAIAVCPAGRWVVEGFATAGLSRRNALEVASRYGADVVLELEGDNVRVVGTRGIHDVLTRDRRPHPKPGPPSLTQLTMF